MYVYIYIKFEGQWSIHVAYMGTDGDQPVTTFSILNIQGLKPRTVLSKIPYIQDLIQANNQMFIAITETWLRDSTDPELCVKMATQSSDKNANIIINVVAGTVGE